ncbi:MAG TPA: hypothetical protein VK660_10490, partial [Xanthomonadaceae bacterium]|nr:hypothetical protein [Xanthomonadaceae bacterium]
MNESNRDATIFGDPNMRGAVGLTDPALVRVGFRDSTSSLPLIVEPNGGPVDLVAWARHNQPTISTQLVRYGAIM